MKLAGIERIILIAAVAASAVMGTSVLAQEKQYPKQSDLPNPYRLEENWPTLPASMNGGHWGELIRADIDPKGNIWVFHRCFNTSRLATPPAWAARSRRFCNSIPLENF